MTLPEIKTRGKELFGITAPVVVEQAGVTAMGLVSTWLVNSVGMHAVTAVGMVDSISNLLVSLFAALTTGGTIVVAQYIGAKARKQANSAAAQAILLSLVFALVLVAFLLVFRTLILRALFGNAEADVMAAANLFFLIVLCSYPLLAVFQTAFGILRGSGNTRVPMLISVGMNIINLLLGLALIRGVNIGFIHTPGFGVAGVAWALVTARLTGFAASLVYLFRLGHKIRLNPFKDFKPDFAIQKTILGLGVPTSVESSLFNLGKLLTMTYIVSMGTEAAAANSIGGSIAGFLNVPGSAISTAVMILVGQRVGRGQEDDVVKTTRFSVAAGSAALGCVCLICFFFNNSIVSAYHLSAGAAAGLTRLNQINFVATPLFWCLSFLTPAALRATGDVKYTMVVAIVSMWVVRVILGYVLGVWLGWGIVGVWLAMFSDWVVRGVLFYLRLLSGKWRGKGIKKHV